MKAPCALVGAELPPAKEGASEPFRIEVGKIRGVESRGMLCSARELKLSEDHEGLLALDDDAPVGADVREVLRLDDTIFTLKLTPNLGHALSVLRRRARSRGDHRRAAASRRRSPRRRSAATASCR